MSVRVEVSPGDLPRVLAMLREAGQDMDVTVSVVSERQRPEATESAHQQGDATPAGHVPATDGPNEAQLIGREAMDKLVRLASPQDRRLLVSFIEQQIREHGARVDPGPADLKYVRLHLPSHRGAYCYPTTRGFVDFRLRPGDAEGYRLAFVRGGAGHGAPFCVRLRLDSDAAMDEALALARAAAARLGGEQ